MELFIAIALLCQTSGIRNTDQLECQQSYVHCVNTKPSMPKHEALERCILEKK